MESLRQPGHARFEVTLRQAKRNPLIDIKAVTLCVLMWQLSEEIALNFEGFFTANGLSRSAFGALSVLSEAGPLSPLELSKALGLTKSSITGILATLRKRGLIQRTRSKEDLRSTNIRVSTKGASVVKKLVPQQLGRMERVFKNLSDEEIDQALRLFTRVRQSVAQSVRYEST